MTEPDNLTTIAVRKRDVSRLGRVKEREDVESNARALSRVLDFYEQHHAGSAES